MSKKLICGILFAATLAMLIGCPPPAPGTEAVTGVTITNSISDLTLKVGDSLQLVAEVAPPAATDKTVKWTSADEAAVSVDSSGVVTAKAVTSGVDITATTADGGFTDSVTVIVEAVKVIGVNRTMSANQTVGTNRTVELGVVVVPEDATDKSLSWTSSDENHVTVDSSGAVTGVAVTTSAVSITATTADGSYETTFFVGVEEYVALTGLSITPLPSSILDENDVGQLSVSSNPSNATNQRVSWQSSNESVVTVSPYGKITAVGQGAADITVISNDDETITDTLSLTVKADEKAPRIGPPSFVSETGLLFMFSEPLDKAAAETLSNYVLSGPAVDSGKIAAAPASVEFDGEAFVVNVSAALSDGDTFTIAVNNLKDAAGNVVSSSPKTCTFHPLPSPLVAAKVDTGSRQISGKAGAYPSTVSPNSGIIAVPEGKPVSTSSIIAMSLLLPADGSFPALMDIETLYSREFVDYTFEPGKYRLAVVDQYSSISPFITVTVP